MEPSQWLAQFRLLHDQARKGTLKEGDAKKYLNMKDELARSLMSSQGTAVPDGVPARRAFMVAHVFPLEVAGLYRTTTRDVSCTGFTAFIGGTLKAGEPVDFKLTLSRGNELSGTALVATAARQTTGVTRVSCTFGKLDEERLGRLELALFDAALSRIGA